MKLAYSNFALWSIVLLLTLALMTMIAIPAFAQTSTATDYTSATGTVDTTDTTTSTPGLPDTGAGGDQVMMMTALAISGVVALGGAAVLLRRYA